ncbi:MAG: hypothetical protein JWQ00_1060, partial [Noviherbaspirillum sp.]|nr:hypothetical protein [Noviherbaspirillum sp.]
MLTIKFKSPAAAIAGIGAIASAAYGNQTARAIDPAVLLGIDSICRSPSGNSANGKLFFKIAAAKNELQPYGQLPKAEPQAAPAA